MGHISKAQKARQNNLPSAKKSQNPTVEEIPDIDDTGNSSDNTDEDFLEQGFFIMDEDVTEEDSNSDDSDFEEDIDEDELQSLQNEADIDRFNAILIQAQLMAVKAEREAAGEKPKRKQHYTGNSKRTKRHHAQKRRELAAKGQPLISSMFAKTAKAVTSSSVTNHIPELPSPPTIHILDDEPEEDDEIEIALKELFPGSQKVNTTHSAQEYDVSPTVNSDLDSASTHSQASSDEKDSDVDARKKVEELL